MVYDFSKILYYDNDSVLDDFIYEHTSCAYTYEEEESSIIFKYYEDILNTFKRDFEAKEIVDIFENLAKYKISLDVPYVIMINEIYSLKDILTSQISDENLNGCVKDILKIFKIINNKVAYIYLHDYINKLISSNNIRHSSLSDLVEKNFISHYESHLEWLSLLATHIRDEKKDKFVELDHKVCQFGTWLEGEAKQVIKNNSKYKVIYAIHKSLHMFASKIYEQIGNKEYHVLITYLEKCELISLSIGTELALIDNMIMNKRVTKDTLTGSLNRQALRGVFESQYELSLATSNPFVLAICDLDFFKVINDTYGHIAGDKMLKLFVDTVKSSIRNTDIIIRYGGEEFIVMVPATDKTKAKVVLEKIRKSFENVTLEYEGKLIKGSVSIGAIEINPEYNFKQNFIDEYIAIADQKLYSAKKNGRNRIEI
jgi:diguanylate cyclase (GGDEF)-like protein